MMRRFTMTLAAVVLLAVPAMAGVVYEIETTDHMVSPPASETNTMSVEGENLVVTIPSSGQGEGTGRFIFRGDRQEMIVIDDADKSYMVIDQKTMEQLAGQMAGFAKQMEEALKNVPEEQRAMVERMMKQQMQNMPQATAPAAPKVVMEKTGERGTQAGYPCVKYIAMSGTTAEREVWVTDWKNVEGGDEFVGAFEAMAEFMSQMLDSLPSFGAAPAGFGDSIVTQMKDMDGFPVVTRELSSDGSLESESTLRSSKRQKLDPAIFEPPADYKRRSMTGR